MGNFNYKDVIEKFGMEPKCYLTGEQMDLTNPDSYACDHIIPVSRDGDNSFENFELCTQLSNKAKTSMTPEELVEFCKQVLEYRNYTILPPSSS